MNFKYLIFSLAISALPALELSLSPAVMAAQASQDAQTPNAYPWQLTDFSSPVTRVSLSNTSLHNMPLLEKDTYGTLFTWGNYPYKLVMASGSTNNHDLTYYWLYAPESDNPIDLQKFDMNNFSPDVIKKDLPGAFYSTNTEGQFINLATGYPVHAWSRSTMCFGDDPLWLTAGYVFDDSIKLTFDIIDAGNGEFRLKDQTGKYAYLDRTPHRIPFFYGVPACASGNSSTPLNKFHFKRVTQKIPHPNTYYPLNRLSGNCDIDKAHCGYFVGIEHTTDRFGRPDEAIKFNNNGQASYFEFPIQLWSDLANKQQFSIGFWARLGGPTSKPYQVTQDEKFNSILYGTDLDHSLTEKITFGLSVAEKSGQLALNQASYLPPEEPEEALPDYTIFDENGNIIPPTPIISSVGHTDGSTPPPITIKKLPKIVPWKFWLPPNFNTSAPSKVSQKSSALVNQKQWVYILISYDENRTAIYMHNPARTDGNFVERFTQKYFTLMNTDALKQISGFGFGLRYADKGLGTIDAIDDVTFFSGSLEKNESYVRAALGDAILGDRSMH